MKNLTEQFLRLTYTKSQAIKRLRIIRDYLNFFYFKDGKNLGFEGSVETYLKNSNNEFDLVKNISFIKELGEDFFKSFDPSSIDKSVTDMEDAVVKTKTVILYIPFELPENEIISIGYWFKKNMGELCIYEPTFKSDLVGGTAISYNGIYKDYSLKQKIADNRALIIQTLKGFIK